MRILFAFFIFVFFTIPTSFADPLDSKQFMSWVKRQMQANHVPGVSIVIIRDYKIDSVMVFGVSDITTNQPITDTTLFQAGSISKPVTAMAVLKAVQDGKFSLNDDIHRLLRSWEPPPNPYTKEAPITIEELLSHSAGFNVPGFIGYAQDEKIPTLLDILNGTGAANSPPIQVVAKPGEKYLYSGGGYSVLQQLLVDTYHEQFAELMDKTVLQPLSMSNSTFNQPLPANLMDQIAKPYRPDFESVKGGPHTYIDQAAAGLWSTPFDLAKFVISIQESLRGNPYQVLKPESAKLMMEPIISNMGLGFFVNVDKYGRLSKHGHYFMHPGQNEGYRNMLIASTEGGYGAIIMTNMSPDGRLVMSGKIKDRWKFMDALVTKIAELEEWE